MPTPNWGPQAGIPMDDATFDAYVSSNPPTGAIADPSREVQGSTTGTILENSAATGGASYNPYDPNFRPGGGPAADGASFWTDFFNRGPNSVQMPTFQTANQEQARLRQQQVIQDLQTAAMGDPNSRAQQGLKEAYGAAGSQQSSLGSTMRGQDAGAAMRSIGAGQQGIQRGFAGDQQQLQVQEQQAAQQMLAQVLSQQQGQDITQAQGMAQGVNQGNAMNESMRQFYAAQGLQGGMEQEQRERERRLSAMGVNQAYTNLAQQNASRLTQAGASFLGGLSTSGSGDGQSQQPVKHNPYGGDHG